jgi:hypothetical protein
MSVTPVYRRNDASARLCRMLWCSWRHRWHDDPAAIRHAQRYGTNVPISARSRKMCWACRDERFHGGPADVGVTA